MQRAFLGHRVWMRASARVLSLFHNVCILICGALPTNYLPVFLPHGRHLLNINSVSIDYALRPRLRSRLTRRRIKHPWKPWVYGEQDSHLFYRYSCLHPHSPALHAFTLMRYFTVALQCTGDALLPHILMYVSAASVLDLIANHFRRKLAR